jgi:FAD/FMN-containing dehydrogenase
VRRLSAEELQTLRSIVGDPHVLVDADLTSGYSVDWTGRFQGSTQAVVRPGSTREVSRLVSWCLEHDLALVPQGGNTGLVGGGVPLGGELVLSLRRLGDVGPVDGASGQLTAGAGVTIAAVQAAAAAAGWAYGVDLAARDSATVGGTIATNAGGLRVLRYGATRAQVLGVEAVLGDGSVVSHLGGLLKDNTGYDLAGLLCGSEGTLGVITAARLRLVPPLGERVVALLGLESVAAMIAAVGSLRRQLPALEAVEVFFSDGLDLVCETFGLARPFARRRGVFLLLEAAAATDPTDDVAAAVGALPGVAEVAVATAGEPARQAELWRYREAHTEAINSLGPPHKLDVTLPAAAMARFVELVPRVVADAAPESRCWLFGHAADGNLHVNVTGVDPGDDSVDEAVLELVAALDGSISAEHGIGTAKKPWLGLNRSPTEIQAFRRLKAALDPGGILNPNVLLP